MASIEGQSKEPAGYQQHNATFYELVAAVTAWTKVEFTDYAGVAFDSKHIRLNVVGANPIEVSFDPRDVKDAERVVEGVFSAAEIFFFHSKHATEIRIRRSGGADSSVRLMAWR